MDLIDRYLHAVRDYLPGKGQRDIVRELADDIRAQASDREEELGRRLSADEQAMLLKRFGHPMLLASKYRPAQALISPVLLPFYWRGLKISLGIALAVQAAAAIAMIATGSPGAQVIGRLAAFPFTGFVTIFGWITLGFALVDLHVRHVVTRAADSWDPRTLSNPPRTRLPKPAWSKALELAFNTVGLIWWTAIPAHPWLVFGPAASFLAMGPAWQAIHLPVAAAWLVSLAGGWTLLVRPDLPRLRVALEIGSSLVTVLVASYLLRADAIVTSAPGLDVSGANATQLGRLVRSIDVSAHVGALVVLAVAVWELGRAFWNDRSDA